MSLNVDQNALSDADLLSAVQNGDADAYGVLFERHRDAALRLARQLDPSNADDLVSESFVRVYDRVREGRGPEAAFRAYLLTSLRHLFIDRQRSGKHESATDDFETIAPAVPFTDTAELGFERSTTAQAFTSLPERWQAVLWHIDVEGAKPAEVAPLLGLTPNSVSALLYRAREGLRQSYLQHHITAASPAGCEATIGSLGAYVRGGLSSRELGKVESHLDTCRSCMGLVVELQEMNQGLGAFIAPLVLGAAAIGYVPGTTFAGTTTPPISSFAPIALAFGSGVSSVAVAVSGVALATSGTAGDSHQASAPPVITAPTSNATAPTAAPVTPTDTPTPPVVPPFKPGESPNASTIPALEPNVPTRTPDPKPTAHETSKPTKPHPKPTKPHEPTPTPSPTVPQPTASSPATPTPTVPTPTPPVLPLQMPLNVGVSIDPSTMAANPRLLTLTWKAGAARDSSPRNYSVIFTFVSPADVIGGAITKVDGPLVCPTTSGLAITCSLQITPGEIGKAEVTVSDSDIGGTIEFVPSDSLEGVGLTLPFAYTSVRT
jgi:RNA polymerase sigma factor (sigma-70 family)